MKPEPLFSRPQAPSVLRLPPIDRQRRVPHGGSSSALAEPAASISGEPAVDLPRYRFAIPLHQSPFPLFCLIPLVGISSKLFFSLIPLVRLLHLELVGSTPSSFVSSHMFFSFSPVSFVCMNLLGLVHISQLEIWYQIVVCPDWQYLYMFTPFYPLDGALNNSIE